jgi:hypothetical protein
MKKALLLWCGGILFAASAVFAAEPSVDQLLNIILNGTWSIPVSTGTAVQAGSVATGGAQQSGSVSTGIIPVTSVVMTPIAPTPAQDDEFTAALSWMYTKWLTQFSSSTLYQADMKLTRQQAAKFFVVMQESIVGKIPVSNTSSCVFTDTWFDTSLRPFVDKACTYGILQGSKGIFRPNDNISKPEFAAALVRMIEWAKRDESKNPRWISYYQQARDRWLTKEQNAWAFDTLLTRYEAALFLYRSLAVIQSSIVTSGSVDSNTTWVVVLPTAETPTNAYITSLIADPALQESIFWMYDNGLTRYTSIEGYRPFDTLTREEAAKIFSLFKKAIIPTTSVASWTVCAYSDIDKADISLAPYIIDACKMQIFKGWTGTFEPLIYLTKPQAVAILVRLLEGAKDETTDPRWTNYYKRAVELGMIQNSSPTNFDKPISRYEIALLLYNTKVKENIIKNLNSDVETNKFIYPVPGTITTGAIGETKWLISLNTQILNRGDSDIYTIDLFGDQYKIEKSATQKYLSNDYVRYGKMLSLDQANELGTAVFTISNSVIIDGVIRPYKVSPQTTFYITPATQQPYYTMTKKVK